MPMAKLKLLKGVDLEQSPTLNEGQLTASNLIRFYANLPQKLGGWQQMSADTFVGVCRGLHGWSDIKGNSYIAIGTDQRLEVLIGGMIADITPLIATENPTVAFSTSTGSPTVTIKDTVYSPAIGDWINLLTQVSVGGIVLLGFYIVTSVIDATHYTVTAASNATGNVTDGGAVPTYTTINTSATITVTLASHGFSPGSIFQALVSTTVATVVIFGSYSVVTTPTSGTFTITAGSTANAGTTAGENGGNARIEYLLPSGLAVDTALVGYGIGDYGAGDYGVSSGDSVIAPLRQWSLDNWGQDLIANPSNGGIYYWIPPDPSPAVVVPNSPLYSAAVFVMPQVQIIVALGTETGSVQEPLLSRWCDQGDFTDWTASATNQAGSYFYPTGSRLVGGLAVGLGAIVWTDVDLWSMTYLGFPLVFGFNRISTQCGLLSQRCAGAVGNLVMWLSTHQFFKYSTGGGGAVAIECSVWDFYWNNTDQTQLGQYHCAVNANFNEIAWHFPIATASPIYNPATPMAYVKYNYVEDCWDYGYSAQYQRTAWIGHSAAGSPVGADTSGLLQAHEIGYDANGVGMQWSWLTGYFDVADGEDFVFIDLLIPDNAATLGNPNIQYTIYSQLYPNTTPSVLGPYSTSDSTRFVPFRTRARQVAIGASGSDLGTFNRLGGLRYRFAPDGRQ